MPKLIKILISACLTLMAVSACSSQTVFDQDSQAQTASGNNTNKADADSLLVVDCLLPGQIRKLGTSYTFISPRQPIRTTAVNCEIRGGEYVSYDRADYRTALNVWLESAKAGDANSQVYVGEIYEKGLGTVPDYTQAAAWYRKAANQGNSRGAINLGYLYEKGLGVEQDTIAALNWYRKASGLDDDDLQFASTIEAANEEQLGQLREELTQSQTELASLRARLRTKEQQLHREQTALDSTEQSLDALKQELERRKSLTGHPDSDQLSELQKRMLEQQASVDRQRAENETLKARLEQQRDLNNQEQQASAQQLKRDLAQQNAELDKLRAELGGSRQQLAAAEQQLRETRSQLTAEQDKTRQAYQELASITSEKQTAVQQLQSEIKSRERDIEQLRARLTSETENSGTLTQTLQQEFEQQQAGLLALQEEYDNATRQLALTREQLNDLNSQLKSEQDMTRKVQQQLASTTVEKQDLVLQLEREIKQKETDMEQLQRVLKRELEQAGSHEQALQQELTQQRQETASLSQQYQRSQENLAAAESSLESLKVQLAEEQSKSRRVSKALADSTDANQAEIKRLEAEIEQREAELVSQRGQIAELQSETARYKASLESARAAGNTVALQGPTIEILDPPVTLTRGLPSVQLRSAMKERTIIGKVTAPSGLLTLTVNDLSQTPDEFGVFNASIPVDDTQTLVKVVAVDKQGKSAAVKFELIPKLRLASASKPRPERLTPAQSLRRYPVDFGNYYALIIGNNNYTNFPNLNSAVNDAQMADRILREKYGFKTELLIDADRYSVLSALNSIREKLTEDDNLLIYYAGHGELDKVNQRGHWLPVDAEPNSTANWISNVDITDILNAISARHVMVVADSCYSGTMTRSALARLDSGMEDETRLKWFKVMAKTRSRSVLTSGGLKPVLDSGSGNHSVFANAFFKVLNENNDVMEGYKVYRQVSEQVKATAAKYNLEQIPQYAPILHGGHEAGEFFFVPSNAIASRTRPDHLQASYRSTP
jgi:hypothetical protein